MTEYNQSFEPTFENKMKMITGHYAVPADLQPYIDSFWYVENSGPETETSPWQYCLATGLVEIIIHIRPPYTHTGLMSGKRVDFPVSFLGGIHVEPVLFQMKGGCGMFGISCKPEMFLTLFNMPIGALADYFTDLRSIFGKSGDELTERIQDAPSHENRVQEAVNFFRKRAASPAQQDRYYFSEAMQYIRMGIGQHSVDDLCGKVFVGKRQLQRVFQENIGISPKVYGRIIRFKSAYDYTIRRPPGPKSVTTSVIRTSRILSAISGLSPVRIRRHSSHALHRRFTHRLPQLPDNMLLAGYFGRMAD